MRVKAGRVIVRFGVPLIIGGAGFLAFLGRWEGEGRTVYADKLAGGLPTACFGITKHTSPVPVIVGEVWSEEKCYEVAAMVVEDDQLKLSRCIRVAVSQNTFDALSSHAHNFGVGNTCASRALELINRGRLVDGCHALAHAPDGRPVWSYVTEPDGSKRFVKGLYNRRLAERDLCLS